MKYFFKSLLELSLAPLFLFALFLLLYNPNEKEDRERWVKQVESCQKACHPNTPIIENSTCYCDLTKIIKD